MTKNQVKNRLQKQIHKLSLYQKSMDKDFKIMIINMFKERKDSIDKVNKTEEFRQRFRSITKDQMEILHRKM